MAIYSRKNTGIRVPGSNKLMTVSLFADVSADTYDNVIPEDDRPFWLEKDEKGDGRPCFRDLYLAHGDLTGAAVAVELFGSTEQLDHLLRRSVWFKDAFGRMKKELQDRLVAKAQQKILEIMEGEGATALAAAKYLHSNLSQTGSSRGRTSKAEVKGNLKELTKAAYEDDADFERITKHLN